VTVLAAALLAVLPGCGGSKASVSGKVTYRGKPLTSGTIYVALPDGIQVPTGIGTDGSYRFDGVATGSVKFGVTSPNPAHVMAPRSKRAPRGAAPPPLPQNTGWFEIPDKYADPLKSGLSFDLKGGANEYDIKME
jgi:hypothetical protein